MINNILIAYYSFTEPVISGLNSWIASFINLFPSIVLGVVMFTLALKLVTFPLDFYSRASMRRNSLKMEQMRPQLEKLQKQYADDKQTYQMKMAALYKKEGYSMFGACLPTIVTLVFFIIVLNAFNAYSIHQNVKYLYNMNTAFNSVVDDGLEDVENYIRHENGKVIIDDAAIFDAAKEANDGNTPSGEVVIDDTILTATYVFYGESSEENIGEVSYKTKNGYIEYKKYIRENEDGTYRYVVNTSPTLIVSGLESSYGAELKNESGQNFSKYYYEVAVKENPELDKSEAAESFVLDIQRTRSADKYREEEESFLWIKNIWMPDTPFQHPVYADYATFNSKFKLDDYTSDIGQYDNLTFKLAEEKEQVNGYFVLVILTAGTSLLMQWIMSRGQKAQMELQSVDGQGQMTQKVMMWMMPIMMGFFALMYTAAFSVYIITSSVISMLTTMLINKVVDIRFKKQLEAEENGTAKSRRVKVKDANGNTVRGKKKGSAAKPDKDARIVKKVVLERKENGLDDKNDDNGES